jgi:hypothetical protein
MPTIRPSQIGKAKVEGQQRNDNADKGQPDQGLFGQKSHRIEKG